MPGIEQHVHVSLAPKSIVHFLVRIVAIEHNHNGDAGLSYYENTQCRLESIEMLWKRDE